MTAEGPYIFAGTSNEPLARAICEHLGVPLRPTRIERFSNGTLKVQLGESVRNKDVYIIQSLTSPVSGSMAARYTLPEMVVPASSPPTT